MLIDALLVFQKDENTKSKYVLSHFSNEYDPLMIVGKRTKQISVYLSPAVHRMKKNYKDKPSLSLSGVGSHTSTGLFTPCLEKPNSGYGDILQDALIVNIEANILEVLVCKGRKEDKNLLFNLYAENDSDFLGEIAEHKSKLKEWKSF